MCVNAHKYSSSLLCNKQLKCMENKPHTCTVQVQLTDQCCHSRILIRILLHKVHETGKRVELRSNILVLPSQQHTLTMHAKAQVAWYTTR